MMNVHELVKKALKLYNEDDCSEEAFRLAQEAYCLDCESTCANSIMGKCLYAREQYQEAEKHCRFSYEKKPKSKEVLFSLGVCLREQGKYSEAEIYLEKMWLLDEENPRYLMELAFLYLDWGVNLRLALELVNSALKKEVDMEGKAYLFDIKSEIEEELKTYDIDAPRPECG